MVRSSSGRRIVVGAVAVIQSACVGRSQGQLVRVDTCPHQPRGTASIEHRATSEVSDDLARAQLGGLVIRVLVGIPDSAAPVAAAVTLHADTAGSGDGGSLRGANAGPIGTVRWDSIPVGTYRVVARAVGFSRLQGQAAIVAGRADTMVMRLRTDPHCLTSDPPAT